MIPSTNPPPCLHKSNIKFDQIYEILWIVYWPSYSSWWNSFLSHLKGSGELLSPLSVRPSVNFSHFNQLLWSHWANLNQTLVEWSLDGPLPKLCPVILTSNQDDRQAKNRKKGDEILIVHCCFSISQIELKF
jgi:hypothetical protein